MRVISKDSRITHRNSHVHATHDIIIIKINLKLLFKLEVIARKDIVSIGTNQNLTSLPVNLHCMLQFTKKNIQ